MLNQFKRIMTIMAVSSFLVMSVQAPAYATLVSNSEIQVANQVEQKRDQIHSLLAREDVKKQLLTLGVDPSQIEDRIGQLSDAEVLAFHEQIEEAPAGGVLGAILLIIVIFMLLDIAGATDVFPRI